MTKQEYLATWHGQQLSLEERIAVEYSGVVNCTPEEFEKLTGIVADFSRPHGEGSLPVSVVYRCIPGGLYRREKELVNYMGVYPSSGPAGGIHTPQQQDVEFVVTRADRAQINWDGSRRG